MDAQSVKNTDSAAEKGDDAGKKVSGIQRHIAVDTQGLPPAMSVTTANTTDRKGALAAFSVYRDDVTQVQCVLGDAGYSGQPFADGIRELMGADVQIAKRRERYPSTP